MLIPCEVATKTVLPSLRALTAKTLMEKHQMKEKQAAKLLGISQSAISKYSTKVRGNNLKIENLTEVQTIVDQMIHLLIHEPDKKSEIARLFCQACTLIRKKGTMCASCQLHAPKTETQNCNTCIKP